MKKYILFLILLAGLWSCDNFLTVKPKSQIDENTFFSTAEGHEEALYGIYASMDETGLYGIDLRCGLLDAMGQYYSISAKGGAYRTAMDFAMSDDLRKYHDRIWTELYKLIGYTNNLITSLEKKDESSMQYYNLYFGEALGLRAFMHFDLVRLYAPHVERKPDVRGIPYVTKWTVWVSPFETVKEVYDHILFDLKRSETCLMKGEEEMQVKETEFAKNRFIHFNLNAARATLARVYWMKGDLDSAYIYAKKVIESKKNTLATSSEVSTMYAGAVNRKETIFGLFTNTLLPTYKKLFYERSSMEGRISLLPRADYGILYANEAGGNDMRLNWYKLQQTPATGQKGEVCFMKLFAENQVQSGEYIFTNGEIAGISLISLPEMYLIAAEALLEKNPSLALEYFDTFITSRGLVKYADRQGVDKKELGLEDIYKERTKEFAGDGQEFFAMKKQLRALASKKLNEESYVFQIPDNEFEFRPEETDSNNE